MTLLVLTGISIAGFMTRAFIDSAPTSPALTSSVHTPAPTKPNFPADPNPPANTESKFWENGREAKILRVVDGDTVVLDFGEGTKTTTARLIGINTPEVKSIYTNEQCFGPEASARLKYLADQETDVYVMRDVEALDIYDRFLAYLFRASDGKFINELMLEEGYATVLSIAPNTAFRKEFKAAETRAKSHNLGLWGACANRK